MSKRFHMHTTNEIIMFNDNSLRKMDMSGNEWSSIAYSDDVN